MRLAKIFVSVGLFGFASISFCEDIVEKAGRFEVNWTQGKIRFYGTAIAKHEDGPSWRVAEQTAWAEGLKYFETNFNKLFASRIGQGRMKVQDKPSLLKSTSSLNTTYYGDDRVKVALEASISEVLRANLISEAGTPLDKPNAKNLIIALEGPMAPVAIVNIVDENGSKLVSENDIVASIAKGGQIPKYFKNNDNNNETLSQNNTFIEGRLVSPSTVQIARKNWSPDYAGLIANGRVAFSAK